MCPDQRTANEYAACRWPYLREHVPQDPPGGMPGHGAAVRDHCLALFDPCPAVIVKPERRLAVAQDVCHSAIRLAGVDVAT
jgi:hypothetical protein